MLGEQDVALVDSLRAALAAAPRDAVCTAAAAAYDSMGATFTGMNLEHPAGGACAELVVAGAAAASPDARLPLTTMVTARPEHFAPPCLSCCRVLRDLYPELRIILPVLVQIGTPLGPGAGFQATPISRVLRNQERDAARQRSPAHVEGEPDR